MEGHTVAIDWRSAGGASEQADARRGGEGLDGIRPYESIAILTA